MGGGGGAGAGSRSRPRRRLRGEGSRFAGGGFTVRAHVDGYGERDHGSRGKDHEDGHGHGYDGTVRSHPLTLQPKPYTWPWPHIPPPEIPLAVAVYVAVFVSRLPRTVALSPWPSLVIPPPVIPPAVAVYVAVFVSRRLLAANDRACTATGLANPLLYSSTELYEPARLNRAGSQCRFPGRLTPTGAPGPQPRATGVRVDENIVHCALARKQARACPLLGPRPREQFPPRRGSRPAGRRRSLRALLRRRLAGAHGFRALLSLLVSRRLPCVSLRRSTPATPAAFASWLSEIRPVLADLHALTVDATARKGQRRHARSHLREVVRRRFQALTALLGAVDPAMAQGSGAATGAPSREEEAP